MAFKVKKLLEKAVAAAVLAIAIATTLPMTAYADSSRIVTLGVDLTQEQRESVLSFFNLDEGSLSKMDVVNVNNQDERRYLEGILPDEVIGWKTLSCSYIEPTDSGGINVQTANLNYVTRSTLYNALQTAGIQNCNLVVTAPFPVSGTGALTGIFMAFESTGTKLDEAKKEAATVELVDTAKLQDEYGDTIAEVISEVKDKVVSSPSELTDDQIKELIRAAAALKGLNIADEDLDLIMQIIHKIQSLDYDRQAFHVTLTQINSLLDEAGKAIEKAPGFFEMIGNFFGGIIDWFKGLLGIAGDKAEEIRNSDAVAGATSAANDFFNNLNTDVFSIDKEDAQVTAAPTE